MSKGNTFEGEFLDHVYLNSAIALIGDASGLQPSATAGSLYVALHTADPGEAGSQNTSEIAYTSYARVAVARTSGGWTRSGNQMSNTATVAFPQCTGGSGTATHFSVGTASTGAGKILHSGPLAGASKLFTAATSDTLTVPGNTFVVDDQVTVIALDGISLPAGTTDGVTYFVKTSSGDAITLSTTQGGATLDITAAGGGRIAKATPLAISNGITPSFAAGTLIIIED
jgi:hypothetical protein